MLKFAIIGCLCVAALVKAQGGPPPPPPPPGGPPDPPQTLEHSRFARQAMPMPNGMPGMPGGSQGGNPGNLAMQGLGNIPDPTAVIAKAQEVGRQFMNGRRRRAAPIPAPPMF